MDDSHFGSLSLSLHFALRSFPELGPPQLHLGWALILAMHVAESIALHIICLGIIIDIILNFMLFECQR
jgi:hypothetical protein